MPEKKTSDKKSKPAKNDDDAALLEEVFRDVTPLPGRTIKPVKTDVPKVKPNARRAPSSALPPPAQQPAPLLPELTHGDAPGVDKRTMQRLQRGKVEIEGKLDLHGMTQHEAHAALTAFLSSAQSAGKKCVLVITGKGLRPDGSVGVLREAVPKWLNQSPNRERIQSFRHAAPKDGGTGALYVLMRRAK